HLDDATAARIVERAVEEAREMIEVDRFLFGLGGFGDEGVSSRVVEAEAALEDRVQAVALGLRHDAVNHAGMHEEGGRRQPIVVLLEPARMLVAATELGDELLERLEHSCRSVIAPRLRNIERRTANGEGRIIVMPR